MKTPASKRWNEVTSEDHLEGLIDKYEAAEIRGVNPQTILLWARFHGLPHVFVGNSYRFQRGDVEKYVQPSKQVKKAS